ncbi:MAG TPA: AMP-binding protein [Patescibacteria group bacterium]|nr:AMP-binding protein [Patescibacteria group bacterium]
MTPLELLEKQAQDHPEKPAFIFKDTAVTFRQLSETSLRLAAAMSDLGVKKGDRVAIYLPNWPEYLYSYVAVWILGACAVPLDFMLTAEEVVSCVAHCRATLLIAKLKATVPAASLTASCADLRHIITCHGPAEGALSWETLLAQAHARPPAVHVDGKDPAIIFYTSGTTGKPKGVLVNYAQLAAPPQGMAHFVDFDANDMTLCALPLSHLGGLIYLEVGITFGFTFVLMERFIPLEFLKNIQHYKANWFWLVPSMYYALLQLKEFENFDLSTLRWLVTFGASNSPDALRRFHRYCPQAHLLNGWGMTETNAPTVVLPVGSQKIESVGRPAPWVEIKIFDEQDQEVACGQVGEVVVRSWVVTDGYYNDPEATAASMRNGWFHTGDLGRLDPEGLLYIVGRKKEMIKVSGEIVFEPEVEAALLKHPDVAEAAVIGVPDKLRGEIPQAFVVLKADKTLSEEDLRYFCRQHLAHFKIPHRFAFRSELLKNRTGKVDKETLRAEAAR